MHAHSDSEGHGARHAHKHDKGLRAFFGYLRLLPVMWNSEINRQVVGWISPRPGERVVDLGAGMGAATAVAARSGATVIAVDPAPYMRRILTLRAQWQRARRRIEVADGAAEAIPAGDGSVDALWTVNTLHHWTNKPAACRELARVLREGGRAVLVDEDMNDPRHPGHERAQARHHHREFEHVEPEALASALLGVGFAAAAGERTTIAGRPCKVIRATR